MNILFYYPDKERAVSLSSLMVAFQKQNHKVSLLTHAEEGDLHCDVKKYGVQTFFYKIEKKSLVFYLRHILYLIKFTRKYKIDVVYSHIQRANLISAFAQYFSKSRFILCRHHSDCAFIENNRNEKLTDKIINGLGKEFIVPSEKVLQQMQVVEKVKNKKIYLIRYAYDFDQYTKPNLTDIYTLRNSYPTKLLILKVARLIPEKRHLMLFKVIKKLVQKKMDIKLLVLSDGPEREKLLKYVIENNLQDTIFMLGYRRDIMNFIASSDLVIHVSESEASSSLVKEVGVLKKAIMACRNVGDFDEYLINNTNSILISKENPEIELESNIIKFYKDEINKVFLGQNLYQTVMERFSLQNIIKQYDSFHIK